MKNFCFIFFLFPLILLGQQYLNFNHNGLNRDYIYYQPSNIQNDAPLLFVAHSYSGSAQSIMNYSGFNALADHFGFAVCYPSGTQDSGGDKFWNVGYLFTSGSNVDDVDFLVSLAQDLQSTYNLSTSNTFMTGMSNGAELCYLLACETSGTFSAFAPVAGTIFTNGLPNGICNGYPVPIFEIHGENDNVSLFNGNLNNQFWGPYLAIDSVISFWVNTSGLNILDVDTLPNLNNNFKYTISYKYSSNTSINEVWLYKHKNGHSWNVDDINVQDEIWDFFSKYIVLTTNSSIDNQSLNSTRKIIKTVNLFGQEVSHTKNKFVFNIYSDGSVEKSIRVE
jgi:polyhydroxybutyrate depolymerase